MVLAIVYAWHSRHDRPRTGHHEPDSNQHPTGSRTVRLRAGLHAREAQARGSQPAEGTRTGHHH